MGLRYSFTSPVLRPAKQPLRFCSRARPWRVGVREALLAPLRSLLDAFARQHGLHIVGGVAIPRSARAAAAAAEKTNVTPQLAQTMSSSLGCSMDFGCSLTGVSITTRDAWA